MCLKEAEKGQHFVISLRNGYKHFPFSLKTGVKHFCFFVKKQGKTFRVFVKKCIIGESKHCAGGLSWNHSIIPK